MALSNFLLLLPLLLVYSTRSGLAGPLEEDRGRRHSHRRLAVDIPDFISIDCGAPVDSFDDTNGIPYKSDFNLIRSGVPIQIPPEFNGNLRLQYRNLRSFPDGARNCYTLNPQAGENNNYLIRAVFMYGNYDRKNTTPIFNIYLGVNLWQTVKTENLRIEAIHIVSTDYIDVCLVNIGSGVPYISALELRRLDNSIYHIGNNKFLSLFSRYDVGRQANLRYPLDNYDRVWEPLSVSGSGLVEISTDANISRSNDDAYRLPESMLKTAYGTQNSTISIEYSWTPNAASSEYFFCFHFMEIQSLASGKVREMKIVLNNALTIARSVKLEYLKPQTICKPGVPVNRNQKNLVRISAASDSDVPPILNGLEVLYSQDLSYSPTFLQDVNAIKQMQQGYKVVRNWVGDPCLPSSYMWEGLKCSDANPPRIVSLNLSRSQLSGNILFELSGLTELESLDLSYNDLTGLVPEFLAQLPRLKTLNLDGNNLGGVIPDGLLQKSRDGSLSLSVNENPEVCWSPPCKKKRLKFPITIVASVVGTALLLLLILSAFLIIRIRRQRQHQNSTTKKAPLKQKNREYSYSKILSITKNFKTTIGEGGFGKVYLGALKDDDNTPVAVKVLSPSSKQGFKEFQVEAQLLMIVHHRNLVSLVGYCDEGDVKALVYEYMVNGNLCQHLSEPEGKVLSWTQRLRIAIDAAHGLDYLHNGCKPPIIHRDLKPSNVLLDEGMQAKISDFGLSRTFTTTDESQIVTQLAGTPGYFDPQNQTSGTLNKKSDIYSFGIILFELITGSPAIIRSSSGDYVHILSWVTPIINSGDIHGVVDMRLKREFESNSAWKMVEIAMSCTHASAGERPDMSHVVEELNYCLAVEYQKTSAGEYYTMSSGILAESEVAPCLR